MNYRDELQRTADRLRQLSPARLAPREQEFYDLLAHFTDRRVPRISPHAWGDQLSVIGADVGSSAQSELAEMLVGFRRGLDLVPGR